MMKIDLARMQIEANHRCYASYSSSRVQHKALNIYYKQDPMYRPLLDSIVELPHNLDDAI